MSVEKLAVYDMVWLYFYIFYPVKLCSDATSGFSKKFYILPSGLAGLSETKGNTMSSAKVIV